MTATRWVAVVAAAALTGAGCGGDDAPGSRPRAQGDPFADVERERARDAGAVRAAPRWEALRTLAGAGAATPDLDVAPRAIQWRARWACERGTLRVRARPARGPAGLVLDERCPASGTATAVSTGRVSLDVAASAGWRLRVDQQVDTPLREPAPEAAEELAAGRFASLERRTRGRARLLRLADDRLALRLDGFVTAASADLYVWVSRVPRPGTSRAALRAPHVELGPLKATAGDQTYPLPRRLRPEDVRSVVIWCEPIRIAYGAAGLR